MLTGKQNTKELINPVYFLFIPVDFDNDLTKSYLAFPHKIITHRLFSQQLLSYHFFFKLRRQRIKDGIMTDFPIDILR